MYRAGFEVSKEPRNTKLDKAGRSWATEARKIRHISTADFAFKNSNWKRWITLMRVLLANSI
jgi:hypothetical protein